MAAKPLRPIFARYEHSIDGWQWGLGEDDFRRVQSGHACGRCLEPFELWTPKCPVCGNEIELVIDAPPEWKGKRE